MSVYKTYLKILKNKRTSILIYMLICIGLTYAFTMNTKPGDNRFETSKVKTMVINEDGQNSFVMGFLDYLDQYVTIVEPGKNEEAIKDALFFGKAEYILTIPKGFSDNFFKKGAVKLKKETVPDSVAAMSMDNIINNYFNTAEVYLKHVPKMNTNRMNSYIKRSLSKKTKTVFATKTTDRVVYSNAVNNLFFNFMGYAIIASFISTISLIMLSFNQVDIHRRHTASPLNYRRLNLQLILANLVFVIGFLCIIFITGYLLNKSRMINTSLLLTWLNAFVFSITVLCISYMVGIMVTNRKAVGAISTVLSLGLSFISGIFVPQNYLGGAVLKFASISPLYWYVKANDSLADVTVFQWNQVSEAFGCMAVEIGFTVAFISIALVISKRKRQQEL